MWLQIQADILNKEIFVCNVSEQACLGACMLAGVSTGVFADLKEAREKFVAYGETTYKPEQNNVNQYERSYKVFKALYQRTKGIE